MVPPDHRVDVELGNTQSIQQPHSLLPDPTSNASQFFEDYHLRLQKACLSGEWKAAEKIHENQAAACCFREKISRNGDTALHIAAAAGRHEFVKQLLAHAQQSSEHKLDLALPNNDGKTAFFLAAASGVVQIVEMMHNLNHNLSNIPDDIGMKPIQIAVLQGHEKMVHHLMSYCFKSLSDQERTDLLIAALEKDLHDVAWKILRLDNDDGLATRRNGNSNTPLHVLARKTQMESRSHVKYNWNLCTIIRMQHHDHSVNGLVEHLWIRVIRSRNHQRISEMLLFPQPELLFVAIQKGNYEFVTTLIRHYPDLIWEKDHKCRTIFHAAVEYRQEKIFSHIFQLEGIRHLLTADSDPNGNNMLHLAATLPEPEILDIASGAALQMQRELLWFQAVESIVPRQHAHSKNSISTPINKTTELERRETPREMFNRTHAQLREEGEKWMRKTSTSCMVVAALVATIVFQAISQPPKVNNISNKIFWVFVISNALSLLSSTASILTFLSILTSTYAEEDFLVSLPMKLMVGLAMLLFSILTILLVFTVSIIILLPYKSVCIIIAVFASLTGVVYLRLYFPLLVAVYHSTFGTKYLFHPQHELFRD